MLRERLPRALQAVNAVVPGLDRATRQMALAIGWFESNYGVTSDWCCSSSHPCCTGPAYGQYATTCPSSSPGFLDGTPSYNWGATIAVGSLPYFLHGDHHADGSPSIQRFSVHSSPEDGFSYFWR